MKSLSARLILGFLGVIVFVLCSVGAILLLILQRNPQEQRLTYLELSAQARLVGGILKRAPRLFASPQDTYARLAEVAENQGVRVAWAGTDDRIVYDSVRDASGRGEWVARQPDLLSELTRGPGAQRSGRIREDATTWLVVAQPVQDLENRLVGHLILAQPAPALAFLDRFRQTLLRPMIQAGLAALAVGVLLAGVLSHSIARPLQKVSAAARAIATGDLSARAPDEEGPEEVRNLARTFNEMASRVEASQQTQRDLVANIAHDLRTPLTSIQGFAQALYDGTAMTPETQRQAATAIYEESQRMHRMVNTLLDLARFEAGEVQLAQEPVDLVMLAQKRLQHIAPQAAQAQITLSLEPTVSHLVVTGDQGRLEQVIDNLLSNAVTHTPAGGQVTVRLEEKLPWAILSVSDTGRGIPPQDLHRIFERFYRSDRARTGSGTGLGLAIVQEIVNAHQGQVQAESVLDLGTKFTVFLPLDLQE